MSTFSFKDLVVWKKSMEFASNILNMTEGIKGHFRLVEQLEACAASVAQNIAEGKGRLSKKEFVYFLCISRGSLYETITLLNLFCGKGWISNQELITFEKQGIELTKMINSLISKERAKCTQNPKS